jgi:anionic cell wall polymer biosynthesis LytR-Cps2A-Psr (LCP) family protein
MEDGMKKMVFALVAALTLASASAQVGKAASEATDAAKHKIDQKRAENEAEKSGPVGKAVNNVKSGYHKKQSERSAEKAKKALKDAG